MPFVLCRILGASGSGVTVEPGPLLVNLLKTILLPLLVGAFARAGIPGSMFDASDCCKQGYCSIAFLDIRKHVQGSM